MMKPIVQLEQNIINKIAAGEVVERPLSVVKELMENSIDAGASVVTVEIKDGGLTSIRVTDNGGGIPADELAVAFNRHATSKISALDDLFSVATLGFRGEALYSIAAVSQLEIVTKTRFATSGARLEIHGGKIISNEPVGCADGTTLIVSNLFYNTPARRKFLKKNATEAGYVNECVGRLALGNPGMSFRFINDGKQVFQTTGSGGLKSAVLQVCGRQLAAALVPVEETHGGMSVSGFVGKPETARGSRQYSFFYINGRFIQSKMLQSAVEAAVKTMIPAGKFPAYAINLKIPFDALDVNVHPAKLDVRFADEEGVFEFVRNSVYEAMTDNVLIPQARLGRKNEKYVSPFEDDGKKYAEQRIEAQPISYGKQENRPMGLPVDSFAGKNINKILRETFNGNSKQAFEKPAREVFGEASHGSLREPLGEFIHDSFRQPSGESGRDSLDKPSNEPVNNSFRESSPTESSSCGPPSRVFFYDYKIMGLLFGTYWLVAQGEELYLIDQHAAHERVLYEEFLSSARSGGASSQRLLEPLSLRLTPREAQTFKDNKEIFTRFGFEAEFGGANAKVSAVPFLFKGPPPLGFFSDVLDKMDEAGFVGDSAYAHREMSVAAMACKAAVKANDALTEAEAEELIRRMLALPNPFTCPHGRPTVVSISKKEIERKFMRTT